MVALRKYYTYMRLGQICLVVHTTYAEKKEEVRHWVVPEDDDDCLIMPNYNMKVMAVMMMTVLRMTVRANDEDD